MNDSLTIPNNIQVGFNNRSDTYTGKLAYVVYKDNKGVLRKEKSWMGWCSKDIPKESYPNEPTSGFVLNKDVGGTRHSYGSWDARIEKVRVYDPRGFEFEIDIPNLLFILQECSSIKGKGLEGEFVYSWSGPNLVLLPVNCQEYKESTKFNQLQTEKVAAKDFVVGCTYFTKKRENVIYLGKHVWFPEHTYYGAHKATGRRFNIFAKIDDKPCSKPTRYHYLIEDGFSKIAKRTSTAPVPQYADEHDMLMKSGYVGVPTKLELVKAKVEGDNYWYYYRRRLLCVNHNDTLYMGTAALNDDYRGYYYSQRNDRVYNITCDRVAELKDGQLVLTPCAKAGKVPYQRMKVSANDIKEFAHDLYIVCEDGSKHQV